MKRTLLMVLILSWATQARTADTHYWGPQENIPLRIDTTRALVRMVGSLTVTQQADSLIGHGRILALDSSARPRDGFVTCMLEKAGQYNLFLDSLRRQGGIDMVQPFYRLPNGSAAYFGDAFVVQFEPSVSRDQIDGINASHSVILDREMLGQRNLYVLRITPRSTGSVVDVANEYGTLKGVIYSQPALGIRAKLASYKLYDYYNYKQPHLKKVIGTFNSASVWDFAGMQRRNPVVAVLDDGVAVHEDLPATRILQGYDFFNGDTNPSPSIREGHGIACTGIIAASNTTDSTAGQQDTTGVFSLNPRVRVLPLKVSDTFAGLNPDQMADAVDWAADHGAEVLSCSWVYGIECNTWYDYAHYLTQAFQRVYTTGRGGKGCAIIFAAGNCGECTDEYGNPLSYVDWPGCMPECYAVGAVDLNDQRYSYSQFGSALDAVAPSGDYCYQGDVWSLDQMGSIGFNDSLLWSCGDTVEWECGNKYVTKDYNCHFGGTSAACPVGSGVASLLLTKDSTLTASMLYRILDSSAVPLTQTVPDTYYGYGRLDAFRAILSISHGDVNNDGMVSLADLSALSTYLTGGAAPFPSVKLGDWNCNSTVDLNDLSACVAYLTGQPGSAPPVRPCFRY